MGVLVEYIEGMIPEQYCGLVDGVADEVGVLCDGLYGVITELGLEGVRIYGEKTRVLITRIPGGVI